MDKTVTNPLRGITMKLLSILLFLCMQMLIKEGGKGLATGQITFFRSLFAMPAILAWLALRGDFLSAFRTDNPFGHFKRGFIGVISMSFGFYALVHLPLPEAIVIGYALPLFTVIAGAILLGEEVRAYRWSAVAVGFVGVMIILWPKLDLFTSGRMGAGEFAGSIAALLSAGMAALAMVQVRQLVRTENTPTIVLYFSLSATLLSLLTIPFGWPAMTWEQALMLMGAGFFGGVAQILLTESYRYADVSTIAPFEYTSIIGGATVGYLLFGETLSASLFFGAAVIISSGVFIIWRESRRGVRRPTAG